MTGKREEGIREQVEAVAVKRVLALQLERAMRKQQKSKQAMARQLRTNRSQRDRLLDPPGCDGGGPTRVDSVAIKRK